MRTAKSGFDVLQAMAESDVALTKTQLAQRVRGDQNHAFKMINALIEARLLLPVNENHPDPTGGRPRVYYRCSGSIHTMQLPQKRQPIPDA